jgi:hypothetical protein
MLYLKSGGKDNFIFIHFGGKKNIATTVEPLIKKFIQNKNVYHAWTSQKQIEENSKQVFEAWREEN